MRLNIDGDDNIAYIRLTGILTKEMILDAFDAAVSHQTYQSGMGRLWDFRDADLSSIASDTVKAMAQYSLRFRPGINDVKVAFVAGRDFEFGLSRMFEMSSNSKTPIRVFRSMKEAREWMMK